MVKLVRPQEESRIRLERNSSFFPHGSQRGGHCVPCRATGEVPGFGQVQKTETREKPRPEALFLFPGKRQVRTR